HRVTVPVLVVTGWMGVLGPGLEDLLAGLTSLQLDGMSAQTPITRATPPRSPSRSAAPWLVGQLARAASQAKVAMMRQYSVANMLSPPGTPRECVLQCLDLVEQSQRDLDAGRVQPEVVAQATDLAQTRQFG